MYGRLISELYVVCSHAVAGAVSLISAPWMMASARYCLLVGTDLMQSNRGPLFRLSGELAWISGRPQQLIPA